MKTWNPKHWKDAFLRFSEGEANSGIVLLVSALIALVWANFGPPAAYDGFWHGLVPGASFSWHLAINDGLMSIFFLHVGLEIKRELRIGELADRRAAAFPVVAAIGGMAVPVALFALINASSGDFRGVGVPMATDIAFSLGILALLGSRIPTALKVFLTAVAIVDDLGGIAVIAVFYNHGFQLWAAAGVVGCALVLGTLNARQVDTLVPYLLVGVGLWAFMLASGIHATVAGVLLAMFIPIRHEGDSLDTPLERLEHALTPWVAFGIVPVFALANAGVDLHSGPGLFPSSVELGIFVGLVLGKPLGILGTCLLAVRLGWLRKPDGVSWTMLGGVGLLAGIGFTMSLFIAQLAFGDSAQLASVKAAILLASATAGVAGFLWLRFAPGPVGRTS